ncbi:glycosyltransferase family 2 protein [Megasphaera cerevisiae]|uniref:glycosyltransferase family 2 protein n=1 Tax=Megasphaera cerevisiae TaxID=39029 RepID=UPI00094428F7|nr:glycosyltransferase [Megasphaera cerevisiae]OKY52778.1 hypothetical protein BSR42_11135 [Megasphaera cerevisiae]
MCINPLISIIVPVYNIDLYIKKCIKSLINQSYTQIEIILVDDGSQDKSGTICDQFAIIDKRITVIHQSNSGVSVARNRGLKEAQGEYIFFVDGDDYIESNMIESLFIIQRKYYADIVQCGYFQEMTDSNIVCPLGEFKELQLDKIAAIDKLIRTEDITNSVWNKLYTKDVIGQISFNPEFEVAEDLLFNYEVMKKANCIVVYNIPLYHYVNRNSSCMRTLLTNKHFQIFEVENIIYSDIQKKFKNVQELDRDCVRLLGISAIHAIDRILYENLCKEYFDILRRIVFKYKWKFLFDKEINIRIRIKIIILSLVPILYKKYYNFNKS